MQTSGSFTLDFDHVPSAQTSHSVKLAAELDPGTHSEHDADPGAADVPALHPLHASNDIIATADEALPPGHGAQV